MKTIRTAALVLGIAGLLAGAGGCFYKAQPGDAGYRPYYEGVNVASPWYGYPHGPPGWYPSPVHLGGGRLGGRY